MKHLAMKQLASSLLIGVLALVVYLSGLSQPADDLILDAWFRLRGRQQAADDIIIVAVGEDFLEAYPSLPIDRRFHARVIDTLAQAGARVIALDVFFPEPNESQDGPLAGQVLAQDVILPHIIQAPRERVQGVLGLNNLIDAVGADQARVTRNLSIGDHLPYNPLLEDATRGVISQQAGARRMQAQFVFQDGTLPSFPYIAARQASLELEDSPTSADMSSFTRQARFLSMSPETLTQDSLLIDYRGPSGSFTTLSFLDIYQQNFSFADVQDKIAIVGYTLIGTVNDQVITPFGLMAGVEVNANKVYTLLHGNLQTLGTPWYGVLLMGLSLVWGVLSQRRRALWWIVMASCVTVIASLGLFYLSVFVSPLLLIVTALLIYALSNYHHLRDLDAQLSSRIVNLLDASGFAQIGRKVPAVSSLAGSGRRSATVLEDVDKRQIKVGERDNHPAVANEVTDTPDNRQRGRLEGLSAGSLVRDAPTMLSTLCDSLAASHGLLYIEQLRHVTTQTNQRPLDTQLDTHADVTTESVVTKLEQLALRARQQGRVFEEAAQVRGQPSYLAAPLLLEGSSLGSLAIALAEPPSDDIRGLFVSSLENIQQLARYRSSAERLRHLTQSPRPLHLGSSTRKLDALGLLADLLQTERSWFGALLETLPQVVFVCNVYGEAIYRNVAARAFFEDARNMLVAIPQKLSLAEDRFREDYGAALSEQRQLELGTTLIRSGAPVLLTLRPVVQAGRVRGVAGMVNNLASIEALYRNRQDMVAMIAHDLRSPLTGIQGFSDLLLETELDEDQQEYLNIISSEAARMARLTDDFLELSRIESGKWQITRGPCDLAELLRYATAALSYEASQKGINFRLEAPSRLNTYIDNHAIRRVITNLLNNAIKYSPTDTQVTAHLEEQPTAFVVHISDEGYGISEEQQANLFQKYQRVGEGPQASIKGTGLGLYMVKLIIDAHAGEISLASARGEGSTFTITLPKPQNELVEDDSLTSP
ncbi:MAG: CHASE2 domain-containing protein [Deinococcota bacterium]